MAQKVLLVEDDNNLREIFEMRLQAEGYDTLTASDGEEALVVALKEKPDLIIADVMMPKMSGFEMIETLRAAPDTNNIKIVMMTALGQAEDQARGEKLGVVKYLVKSQVTLEDFVRVVKEVLGPGDGAGTKGTPTSGQVQQDATSTNNESEQTMPPQDNPTPTNDAPAGDNPISGASGDGQMSSAQAQDDVNKQVDDAMGGSGAPAGDAPGTDNPMPQPPATPPADDTPSAPASPTPPGGM